MPDPFESVLWKIGRAKMHFETAKQVFKAFANTAPYGVFGDFDTQQRALRVRVSGVGVIPTEFALVVGDAAHNARSALDHLIFALARPRNRQEARGINFPIQKKRSDFLRNINDPNRCPIPGVPRGVKTVIESLQPYHSRKRPDAKCLGELKALDDWDKHRVLAMSISSVAGFKCTIKISKIKGTTALKRTQTFRRILKPGAIIARAEFANTLMGAEMQVNPEMDIQPVFDAGSPEEIKRLNALDVIRRSINFIETQVVPSFRHFA